MNFRFSQTLPTQPVRQKNWLKAGSVLTASVVLHGIALFVLGLLGSFGLFGDGSGGIAGDGGDSFSVTWIPGGGSGGGGRGGRSGRPIDTTVPDSVDDGTDQGAAAPQRAPLLKMETTEPQEIFNQTTEEPLKIDSNDNRNKKPKRPAPTAADPDEANMANTTGDRRITPTSARAASEMGSTAAEGDGLGTSGGKGEGQDDGRGNGQGSGNAAPGKGKGGVSFFGIFQKAKKVVYLIDASESMRQHGAMDLAREKLWSSLQDLSPESLFQIVFFQRTNYVFNPGTNATSRPAEKVALVPAISKNLRLARQFITGIQPDSGTDRMAALTYGLSLDPDVIYLLTDADSPVLSAKQLNEIQRANKRKVKIVVIEFGIGGDLSGDNFLKKLSRENYGSHIYHDLAAHSR